MEDEKARLSLRLAKELHAAASHKLIDSKFESFQELLVTLLQEWVEGKRQAAVVQHHRPDLPEVHMLHEILHAGSSDERAAIRTSLKALSEAVRSREPRSSRKRA